MLMKMKKNKKKNMQKNKCTQYKHLICLAVLVQSLILSAAASYYNNVNIVHAAWEKNENGKYYKDDNGEILKGIQTIKDKLYYFDEDGYLETGKFYVPEKDGNFYADENGVIQIGTIVKDDVFYLTDDTGKIKTGFVEYEGQLYYFNANADVVMGWFKSDDKWYYASERGVIATGFISVDGYRYYLGTDGVRVSDTVMEIDGVTYIFNSDGSIDENATLLYPVYQYISSVRNNNNLKDIPIDSRVQACALIRSASLLEGFDRKTVGELESLLKNRAVKCNGGYEFSYGGVENYGIEKLIYNMKNDINLQRVLMDDGIINVGLGTYEDDGIAYFDLILIK